MRSPDEKQVFAAHVVASDQLEQEPLQFETDRTVYWKRQPLSNPAAMDGNLKNSQGYVLDPIFSLRAHQTGPGQRVQVSFITAIAR